MGENDQPTGGNPGAAEDLEKASLDTVYEKLSTSAKGLASAEAKQRLEKYGRNELVEKEASDLEKFLRFFWGPIAWMIEAAALLSLLMGHWADLTIILVLLLYNAISGFWQERKASDALAALKAGMAPKATALRDGEFASIDAAEVVPGDVLRIKLGEVVPADVRFIEGEYISIDQAALTGESLPVSKKIGDEGYSGSIAKDEARRIFERIINYILFRVAMTLDIMFVVVLATLMFVVVLATLFFGFSPLTPVMIILIALLDDIPIMTIAYDNTLLPKEPVRWHMRQLLFVSGFMGVMAVAQSFGLVLIGMEWMSNPAWQSWIKLTQEQIQTAVFLQIVAGGHLLLFVMRSRASLFSPPWPAMPMFVAIVGTQILAVLICGFGWFVTALPWTIVALVWLYMLVWMIVLDWVKLALYSRMHTGTGRPHWYSRFLKGRHPAQAVAQAGNVAQ